MMKAIKKFLYIIFGLIIAVSAQAGTNSIRISNEVIPLDINGFPARPKPLLELGDPLLDVGPINKGFTLPTGAVWQPSFIAWGTYRAAVQSYFDGVDDVSEFAHRFDLHGNLYLTQTERVFASVRFLDTDGEFSSYTFNAPNDEEGYNEEMDFKLESLFFEGDFGELFPFLDREDKYGLDFALTAGRQNLSFQDGVLINDNIDAVGISKLNLKPPKAVNLRTAFVWGGNELNRTNMAQDDDSRLYGLFNEVDFRKTTIEFDAIYLDGDTDSGDGFFGGIGATQRLGEFNTTFRVLGSAPLGNETIHNSSGILLFGEFSWTPKGTHNHVYLTGFRGIDSFRSASRGPTEGGPLGPAGILFEAVGLGRFPAPLGNDADDAVGGALGYQMFFNQSRKQLTLELGGRYAIEEVGQRALGPGVRYQMAVGQRTVLRLDGYALYDDKRKNDVAAKEEYDLGGRIEVLVKF